jgi:hypothetical protein
MPAKKKSTRKSSEEESREVAQELGLVTGVAVGGRGPDVPSVKESTRRALSLLKEEDHLWTIDEYVSLVNDSRRKNNELKEQLLRVETNFNDHVAARELRIAELEAAAKTVSISILSSAIEEAHSIAPLVNTFVGQKLAIAWLQLTCITLCC